MKSTTNEMPAAAIQGEGRRLPPEGKRWQKGQSGNPSGRNQWSERRDFEAAVRQLLRERGDELALVMFERAKRDARFAALLLDRIWPAPKHVTLEADLDVTAHVGAREALAAKLDALRLRLEKPAA